MSTEPRVSGAVNSTTVDWSRWMQLSDQEQRALWAQYRTIIAMESDRARRQYAREQRQFNQGREPVR